MTQGFDGFWYRCEVRHFSVADEYGDHAYTSTSVVWTTYLVVKDTPKGVWLSAGFGRVFVLGTALRQHACPTRELALADAIARKERHIGGCKARLRAAEDDLDHLIAELRGLR